MYHSGAFWQICLQTGNPHAGCYGHNKVTLADMGIQGLEHTVQVLWLYAEEYGVNDLCQFSRARPLQPQHASLSS